MDHAGLLDASCGRVQVCRPHPGEGCEAGICSLATLCRDRTHVKEDPFGRSLQTFTSAMATYH